MLSSRAKAAARKLVRVGLPWKSLVMQLCCLSAAPMVAAEAQEQYAAPRSKLTTAAQRPVAASKRTPQASASRGRTGVVQIAHAEDVPPAPEGAPEKPRDKVTDERVDQLVREIHDFDDVMEVVVHRGRLLRFKKAVTRTAIADPGIADIINITPRELQLVGKGEGATTMSIWFESDDPNKEGEVLTYLVNGVQGPERRQQIKKLEESISKLFPDSRVELIPVADRLVVKGEARDPQQASNIMKLIESSQVAGGANSGGLGASLLGLQQEDGQNGDGGDQILRGTAVNAGRIINLLKVPGQFQVMLKVKIAEINRTAGRNLGVSFAVSKDDGGFRLFQSILSGGSGNIVGVFDSGDVRVFINALRTHSVGKILAQPNLMTISGQSATFIAGGAFAVPTVVGVGGAGAVSTTFQQFGTLLTFTPIVLDKDQIRLTVTPTFSEPNLDLRVNTGGGGSGVPGLNIRSASTTVELREGQVLAIAGLFQETTQSTVTRVPYLGDIPVIGAIFSNRAVNRTETELVVLVEPVLVAPMEPEQLPPVPGFDFKEPDDFEFFVLGRMEGSPVGPEYRSTLWPFHPGNTSTYLRLQNTYMVGPQGHSALEDE